MSLHIIKLLTQCTRLWKCVRDKTQTFIKTLSSSWTMKREREERKRERERKSERKRERERKKGMGADQIRCYCVCAVNLRRERRRGTSSCFTTHSLPPSLSLSLSSSPHSLSLSFHLLILSLSFHLLSSSPHSSRASNFTCVVVAKRRPAPCRQMEDIKEDACVCVCVSVCVCVCLCVCAHVCVSLYCLILDGWSHDAFLYWSNIPFFPEGRAQRRECRFPIRNFILGLD